MNKILVFILLFGFSNGLFSQDNSSYMMVMVKQKKAFKMARNEADFQNLAESFERIANAESDQWHPLYYAGLCYINMSLINGDPNKKDVYLDKAQTFIDKAMEIFPDESELFVLQALLHQGRIQADPGTRTIPYAKKAEEDLEVAKDYNPDNPRVYYLLALNQLHTGDREGDNLGSACENFRIAEEKFNSFRPDHVLSPTWGGERNHQFYTQYCDEH